MATNSLGIVIPISAKIEGWQNSIKEILSAMKKLDLGTDLGKNLEKSLSAVIKLVENMSKNVNLRFTSEGAINGFYDKINGIDEAFASLGTTLHGVSFEDLNILYVSDSFKDLINLINEAKQALETGLEQGVHDALSGSKYIEKVFTKFNIDPSQLNIELIKTALEDVATEAEAKLEDINNKYDEATQKVKEYTEALKNAKTSGEATVDADAVSKLIMSKMTAADFGLVPLFQSVIGEIEKEVSTGLTTVVKISDEKRAEVNEKLSNLVNSSTVDEARTNLHDLRQLIDELKISTSVGFSDSSIKNWTKALGEVTIDKTAFSNAIESIKTLLADLNLGEEVINKIVGGITPETIKNSFDLIPNIMKASLEEAKAAMDAFINETLEKLQAATDLKNLLFGQRNSVSNDKYLADLGTKELLDLVIKVQNENETLKKRVDDLVNQLKQLATGSVTNTGNKVINSSKESLEANTKAANEYKTSLEQVKSAELMIGKIQGVVQRWFSIYSAVRMVGKAIRSVIATTLELDKTITEIAIVTDMDLGELWKQMPQYTAMAKEYAASISGVYEVSLLYYQQGLETADVMALTELTLKMARISGLDYAEATNYMTNALRSFKMEMTEALTIVDVYSAIAASSATDTTELASAMSKTASSAEAVGSSFENTTAMMAVMIEATRESAENIGSAMKSIISRYGEMTSDPSKLVDSEGQEMSLNRVDKALLTVGITIHDTAGEFRDFDDVIMELASKWDTIDKNTQRYIATIMAGNRQQSRFLALVSSYDRLKELSETAANSEDASQLQFLKTLDSIEAKTQLFLTSILSLYTDAGIENLYKGILDYGTKIIDTWTDMPRVFNLPIPAIINMGTTFANLATIVTTVFGLIKARVAANIAALNGQERAAAGERVSIASAESNERVTLALDAAMQIVRADALITEEVRALTLARLLNWRDEAAGRVSSATNATKVSSKLFKNITQGKAMVGLGMLVAGLVSSGIASGLDTGIGKGIAGTLSNVLSYAGMGFSMTANPLVAVLAGAAGLVLGIIENVNNFWESSELKIKRLNEEAEQANNERIKKNAAYNDLKSEIDLVKELEKTYEDSAEAKAEYYEHSNAIAELYPILVSAYDGEGNAILNLANSYEVLKLARGEASSTAITSASKSIEAAEEAQKQAEANYVLALNERNFGSYNANYYESDLEGIGKFYEELKSKYFDKNIQFINLNGILKTLYDNDVDRELENVNQESWLGKIFGDPQLIGIGEETYKELFTNPDNINEFLKEVDSLEDDYLKDALNWIIQVNSLISSIVLPEQGKVEAADAVTKAATKSGIALLTLLKFADAILESQYNNGISADYVSEFSAVGSIINDKIYDLWTEAKEKNSALKFEDFAVRADVTQAYIDIMSEISKFWDSLNPEKLTDLNTLIASRGQYTLDEFKSKLEEIIGKSIDLDGEITEWYEELFKYYDTAFNSELFANALLNRKDKNDYSVILDGIIKRLNAIIKSLGPDELHNLLSIYDSLVDRILNGALTSDDAGTIYEQYIKAFEELDNDVQLILSSVDIFSLTSITSAIETLSSEEYGDEVNPAIEALKQLSHLIPMNLNTEVLTIVSQFTEGLSDFENSIKNATKGMNFKTMSEEAEKLGLEFSDFDLKDGKYYIKNYKELASKLTENLMAPLLNLSEELDVRESAAKKDYSISMVKTGTADIASILGLSDTEYDQLLKEFVTVADEYNNDIIQYYFSKLRENLTATAGEAKNYANDLLARSALESGMVETFAELALSVDDAGKQLWDALSSEEKTTLVNAIISGDISSLTDELRKYFEQYSILIASTYKSILSSIADSMISAVGGGNNKITITETNIEAIKKLGKDHSEWFEGGTNFDNLTVGNTVSLSAEQLAKDSYNFILWLNTEIKDESERLKKYLEYYKNSYSNKAIASFTKIADKDSFSLEDFLQYLLTVHNASNDYVIENWQAAAKSMGLSVNAMGQLIITDYEKWAKELEWATSIIESDGASIEEINSARTILANAKSTEIETQRAAIEDIIKNYTTVTNALKTALANALHIDVKELEPYFELNDDGITSTFKTSEFKEALIQKELEVSDSAWNLFFSTIENMADTILNLISLAGSYISEGTTNFTEMLAFTDEYNNLFKQDLSTAFNYNEILQAWTLNPVVYLNYLRKQIDDLIVSGNMTVNQALDYTRKELSSKIDIASYVGSGRNGFSTESIKLTMIAFNTTFSLYNEKLELAEQDYQKQLDEIVVLGTDKEVDISSIELAKQNIQDILDQIATEARRKAESDLKLLLEGGEKAVEIYKEYTDDSEETFEDIQAVYLNKLNRYQNTISNLEGLLVGSTVDELTAETLNELKDFGFEVDSKGVVKAVGKMEDAYNQLYIKMKDTALATTSQLNTVYAQYLTAGEQPEIDAISALGDAMGMTYDSLGSLLASYETSLEEVANNWSKYGISQIGNGKIRIDDFTTFANLIGLEGNTGEYVTAFKAYNDSLIALDRETNKAIVDEINSIVSAKPGERINLTYLLSFIDKNLTESAAKTLYELLEAAGITFNNGIATIAENANIEEAIALIANQSEINAMMLPDELAALKDAVDSLLTNMISLIKNGISGTLSNADANSLREFAKRLNIDIDFTETSEGLKLSTASAMKLYLQLKQIDKLQAQSLLPDIASMSDNYSSLLKACARYNLLIKTNTDSLRDEKEVLEDLVKSMLTTPDSYNFMSGSLPADWQYAKNYIENLEDAKTKLTTASKAGYMDATDFYNIVSTAGAYNANFSLNGMTAQQLLNAAGEHLTTKGGSMVVDLSAKTGLSLGKNGFSSLYDLMRDGLALVTALAEAYYDLGNRFSTISDYLLGIDIEFKLLFNAGDSFNSNGQSLIEDLKEKANLIPDLKDAFSSIKVGTTDLMTLINSEDWTLWLKAGFTKETFTNLFTLIKDIDWSDASLYASKVSLLLEENGQSITVDTGEYAFIHINPSGNLFLIDLQNLNLRNEVVKLYNKIFGPNSTNSKTIVSDLKDLANQYETETKITEKIKIRRILAIAEGTFDPSGIKYDKDTGTWSYTYNGLTFSAEGRSSGLSADAAKEAITEAVTKAIMLGQDEGMEVSVDADLNVTAHKSIGVASIELSYDNEGNPRYGILIGGKLVDTVDSYEEALLVLITEGVFESDQEGKTIEIKGKKFTTKIDSYTGLAYTLYVDENKQTHWVYEGKDFTDLKAFREYLKLRSEYTTDDVENEKDSNKTIIHVTDKDNIEVVYDELGGLVITYLVDGMETNKAGFDAWIAAKAHDLEGEITTSNDGKSKTLTFYENDLQVTLTVNSEGKIEYTFTSEYGTFTANSEEGYKNALAGLAKLRGGTIDGGEGGDYTITLNHTKVTVKADGTYELDGKTIDEEKLKELGLELLTLPATTEVEIAVNDSATSAIKEIEKALIDLASKTYTTTVQAKVNYSNAKGNISRINQPGNTEPKDRVNLVKSKGNVALAAGTQSTLMGELGPELWVSGGHYYIAGRNGAEFVDLPKDAIVFNHLQTARLLGTGASGRGKPITNEYAAVALAHGSWNGGPARHVDESGSNPGSGGSLAGVAVTLSDDAKSKLSSLISDALSKGFENLDWSDYEDELGSMMDEIKNTARINYRAFIDAYADQCDKTTSEINELYFLAWQKDLEDSMDSEDIVSAAEGLSFYGNGSIGGSSSDWLSIIGDRARITDLVEQGIMSYDAATKQYFVTNAEALANAGVDISQIEGILEMMYDSLRSQYDLIVDYIGNGLEGSLTAMDSKSLQSLVERMGITDLLLDFELTVNGLKLSLASAISLYNELKKVDSIAAQLTFNELVENLLESNDNYKTMTSLLSHIEDLSLKIQDANSYSDERIKLYTEELALAKEIAAVRATSADESMSWYDESIPAGMQNVLDYRQSWADAIDMMRDAQETGVFDFTGFINTAKLINSQAQTLGQTLNFCGYELNGTSEAIDAFITAAANSLGAVTNDNGTNFGVVLEKFGADLTDGAASYENSATSAMQTFAKSQILILDGLIQMFEMIVAMESFKGVDEDDNGLLDWKELFNLDELEENSTEFALYIKTEFKTAAQLILDNAGSNEDLLKALTSVKVNGNTMQELLEYATGAIDKLTYSMTAGDYLKAMSVFYNLLASGDYDLDNIASSLKEALATSGSDFKGTIEYGDFVLDMKYGVTISKTSTGTYKSKSGLEYPTAAEACKATVLEEAGLENDLIVWSADKEVASGTVTYKSFSVEIIADTEGAHYNYNGVAYNSLEDATMAAWNAAGGELGTQLTFDEWKIQQGITVVTTVSKVDTSNISKSLIDKLVGTSWQEIKAKWDAATGDKEAEEEFKIEYGFTLDGASEDDFNAMKERLGITENRMELTLAITNLDEIAAEFASKMTNITLNPTSADATGSATVTADTTEAVTSIGAVEEVINKVIKAIEYLNTLKVVIDKGTAETDMLAIEKATKDAQTAVGNLDGAVSGLTTLFGNLNGTLSTLQTYLSGLSNSTISIHAVGLEVLGTIALDLRSISTDIASLKEKEVKGLIVLNITTGGGSGGNEVEMATGNVIGNGAFAAGSRQVLMGELGPELYVTGGRYYVAGQGGAEFVNLPNDAIVFNHLQTRKLLSTGAAGRGKPVTNEKAATSLATGNAMGLAMATALQTLATLKLLRAMWQSLANASITDMVGLANMKDTESSSDGGSSKIDRKAWIETLEKWYNWLQKIAELEKEINYEEQLRSTLETRLGPKGKELYESLKRELEMIKQQYAVLKSLVDSRREYFEARRAQLNSSVFGKFYLFDEHGQLFYTRGTKFEFGKTSEYVAAQKAAQANGGSGTTTTTTTNAAPEMTKHTAEWNKSIENLALAIYNTRALNQTSYLSDGSISHKLHHYETMDLALKWALTLYRIDENGKATYLGNPTAKGDPLAYSDVSGRLWDIWVKNIGVEFDRLQSGEKERSSFDQYALSGSSEYKKLLSQTIQDTAKATVQEVSGGSSGGGAAGANPPRSELAEITQIEGGFAALMELWARDPQTLEPKYTPAEQYAIALSLGFGNYMLYDQSGNKIEPGENGLDDTFYTSALQALTDNLDADREEMQSLYDSIEEDEKKLLELEQKLNEILLAIRDNQIDVENKILDAIEAREQAIIDELSDTKEVLEDNADKYINGLNEALSNELRMYLSNKSLNELESLRRQLAILQRSGGSASQINSLLLQIDAKEQENYFDAQQLQIDAILAASDLEIERLDKLIEIMETTLEYSKEHGLLWAEVSLIMQLDDAVIMDFLLSNTAEYLASSALQQSATYDELLSMVNQWTAYRDDLNKYRPLLEDMEVGLEDIMANIFSTDANVEDSNVISAIIGANALVVQGIQAATEATKSSSNGSSGGSSGGSYSYDERGAGGSISGASKAGSAVGGTGNAEYNAWLRELGNNLGVSANWQMAIAEGGNYKDEDKYKINATLTGQLAAKTLEKAGEGNGTWTFTRNFVYDTSNDNGKNYSDWELKNIQTDLQHLKDPNGIYKDMSEAWKQNKINVYTEVLRQNGVQGYSSGGSVDYTGLAMVHGTPTRPEYFLDAEETKMWKSDILSANSSSLTSRLLAFREILNGIESASSHINNSTDNGIIIEKAEVNVDVALLANDYDARRAGDTIMDEILQIARKTGVSSVRR